MLRILAWAGGALFVATLIYTVYFYVMVLGDAFPGNARPLTSALPINFVLFGIFAAHHSIFARDRVKQLITRVVPKSMERSLYVWVASILLLAVYLGWQRVEGLLYEVDGPARWAFYLAQAAGVLLTMKASGAIDPLELAGIRQARQQPEATVFRTTGPFGLVRHPIYLGWLLMTFAAPTMTLNRFLFAMVSNSYLVMAIPWEERSLIATFGDRYRTYQTDVRWRLIPRIW